MSGKKVFALVRWIRGKYDGTYTAGVPVDWIKDFNLESFNPNEDPDLSYVVERRLITKKKKQIGNWPCYDARVIMISKNIKILNKRLHDLEGQVSLMKPRALRKKSSKAVKSKSQKVTNRKIGHNIGSSSKNTPKMTSTPKRKKSFEEQVNSKKSRIDVSYSDGNDSPTEIDDNGHLEDNGNDHNNDNKELSSDAESETSGAHGDSDDDNQAVDDTDDETGNVSTNDLIRQMATEFKTMKKSYEDLIRRVNNPPAQNDNNDENDQHELGHVGSGIFIPARKWGCVQHRDTFQTMGRALVRALFAPDILLVSNFRGNRSKINKNSEKRPGLDPNIVRAIEETVEGKFPGYNKTLFGSSINNFLCEMRTKNEKRIQAIH